jgi:hypothetical protein
MKESMAVVAITTLGSAGFRAASVGWGIWFVDISIWTGNLCNAASAAGAFSLCYNEQNARASRLKKEASRGLSPKKRKVSCLSALSAMNTDRPLGKLSTEFTT